MNLKSKKQLFSYIWYACMELKEVALNEDVRIVVDIDPLSDLAKYTVYRQCVKDEFGKYVWSDRVGRLDTVVDEFFL